MRASTLPRALKLSGSRRHRLARHAAALLGTVEIDNLSVNTPEEDRVTRFSPGNLRSRVKMPDDMVNLRGAAYPISVKERQ